MSSFLDTTMKWNFDENGKIVGSEVIEVMESTDPVKKPQFLKKPEDVEQTIQSLSLQCTLLIAVMKHLSMEFKMLSEHIQTKVNESKQEANSAQKAEDMQSMLQQLLFACTVEAMRSGICQHVFELGFDRLFGRYEQLRKLKVNLADQVREEEKIKANEENRLLAYDLLLEKQKVEHLERDLLLQKQKVEDLERHLKATKNQLNQLKAKQPVLKRHPPGKTLSIEIPKSPSAGPPLIAVPAPNK